MARNEDDLDSYLIHGFEGAVKELCLLSSFYSQELKAFENEKNQNTQAIMDLCNEQEKMREEISLLKKQLLKKK